MVTIGSYMRLIAASIGLSSLTYSNAETKEQISDMTVRSIKFLDTYRANVAAYHRTDSIDEKKKDKFTYMWKGSFYTTDETLPKLYNSVEKYWEYSLDLASSNEDNLTSLLVTLQTKMEATKQSYYYYTCLAHSQYVGGHCSEYCRNLASYLIVFSYAGTDRLIEKILSINESTLSAENLFDIKKFQTHITSVHNRFSYFMRDETRLTIKTKVSEDLFIKHWHEEASKNKQDSLLSAERLLLKIMFGYSSAEVKGAGYEHHLYDIDFLKSMWEKAGDINKRLTEMSKDNEEYDVTNAMYDIIIQRAEIWNMPQQDFAKELDEVKLTQLNICITDEGEFSVSLK